MGDRGPGEPPAERRTLLARAAGAVRERPRTTLAIGGAFVAAALVVPVLGSGARPVPLGVSSDALGGEIVATGLGPAIRLRRVTFAWSFARKGRLEPLEEKPVTTQTSGFIKTISPDGTRVGKGEVVLELDTRDIDRRIADREANIVIRKAELVQTERTQAKAVKSAELALRGAELELEWQRLNERAVLAGSTTEELARAEAEIRTRSLVVRNREEEDRILVELAAQGFATATERGQKRLQLTEARLELDKARIGRDELVAGPTELERKEAALQVRIAEYSLDSARKKLGSANAVAASAMAHAESQLRRDENSLLADRENREKHFCRSPADGHILHTPHHWTPEWTPGQRVWPGVKVMSVPSEGKLKVVTQVAQSEVDRVDVGTKCRVTAPARPGRVHAGEVVSVSRQGQDEFADLDGATREKVGESGRQAFAVEVKLLDDDASLRTGFRAEVEFLLDEVEGALVLPWGAVTRGEDGATVTVLERGRPAERVVELGPANRHAVVVRSGCEEGDLVLLSRGGG